MNISLIIFCVFFQNASDKLPHFAWHFEFFGHFLLCKSLMFFSHALIFRPFFAFLTTVCALKNWVLGHFLAFWTTFGSHLLELDHLIEVFYNFNDFSRFLDFYAKSSLNKFIKSNFWSIFLYIFCKFTDERCVEDGGDLRRVLRQMILLLVGRGSAPAFERLFCYIWRL